MRKSAAFFLLFCFAVYHLGYLVVQLLMPLAIHQHWERQIWEAKEALPSERLVKIPFPMPYGQDQEDFQSVNFSMEIDGKMTRVIKQRYFDEHLEVVIVPDQLQATFDQQLQLWISSIGSEQGDFQGSPMQKLLLKTFVKDFLSQPSDWQFSRQAELELAYNFLPFLATIPDGCEDVSLPPPRKTPLS